MADITLNRKHSFDMDTSRTKLEKLVGKFQAGNPGQIDAINWNADRTGATAEGKFFKGSFGVSAGSLLVEIELKGMMAKMAKGVVQQKLEKTVGEEFPA